MSRPRAVRRRETPTPTGKLLKAMHELEVQAHQMLDGKLGPADTALAWWVCRSLMAARILHGRAEDGHGELSTCFKQDDPAAMPILFLYRQPSATVTDLTDYRQRKAARAAAR